MKNVISTDDDSAVRWHEPQTILRIIQSVLPLVLFLVVFIYEADEHLVDSQESWLNLHFVSEVMFFGVMGPVILFLVLGYLRRLMNEQIEGQIQLSRLNRDLEAKVAERTAALEQRHTELAQANDELKELDRMKSDFVALVSHELRAPLTVLNGGLELAAQQAEALPRGARRTLEVMAAETERLTRFVQTILNLSQLEAGKLTLNLGPTAVLPLLERTVETVLLNGSRQILWDVPSDLPPVWADEIYLGEIMSNLVQNADKYSPPGKPIHLSAVVDEERIALSVVDHGPGIPAEIQPHVFEEFYRGRYSESMGPGWGLGLYFSHKLAEAQGGGICFQSPVWSEAEAPGTRFTLTLAVAETPEEDEQEVLVDDRYTADR
ncbi:MAG: HAMP domain-containing histidine kinase [Chloroflexi bacterium]|nr:HAMP domain-containing histidine kinase [Chloroflexota bacterium]